MRAPSIPPDSPSSALDAALTGFTEMIRRVAWRHRLSDADVDDVLQEVRIRIWKASGGGGGGASEQLVQSPTSYVYRTAVSAAIDLIRKQRTERERSTISLDGEDAPVLDTAPTAHAALEGSELAEQVARAIDEIPESRRPAVRMYLAGYSRDDIAELMGWTEAKTRNLLYRGLDDLRGRLAAMGIERETTR